MKKILIATAWPYVNGKIHLGHVTGCLLPADIFARYNRLIGNDVKFVSGSDMHGTPTAVLAQKEGKTPIEVANHFHKLAQETIRMYNISFDLYTSTATDNHKELVWEIFNRLKETGGIIEKETEQTYCEKEEKFLPDRYVEGVCPKCGFTGARGDQCDSCGSLLDPTDLINPKCKTCGETPKRKLTKHMFLDLEKLSPALSKYVDSKKNIWKTNVFNSTESWISQGLIPRAITRDMDYGIPVPLEGYEKKVIYVWMEALLGYLSAPKELGEEVYKKYWYDKTSEIYIFIGKDNIPFHTVILPGLLLGLNDDKINLPTNIVSNEFLNLNNDKFSKSRNNFIEADYIVSKYGTDIARAYLILIMPEYSDSNFTWENFEENINGSLIDNLGNMVNRTLVFLKNISKKNPNITESTFNNLSISKDIEKMINETYFNISEYLDGSAGNNLKKDDDDSKTKKISFSLAFKEIFILSKEANKYFDTKKPWKDDAPNQTIYDMIQIIFNIAIMLSIFLPETKDRIFSLLGCESKTINGFEFQELKEIHIPDNIEVLFKKIDIDENIDI